MYADYLSTVSPQTTSRAVRALLTRGSSKSVGVDIRYMEAYGPHEVMLNIDGMNIYRKTMITCDEDLAGEIYVGREELKVRSIGHCAMLEEDAMHIGTEADVSGHLLDISGRKTQLRGLLDTGAGLSVIPIETWNRMVFDKDDLIDSRTSVDGEDSPKRGNLLVQVYGRAEDLVGGVSLDAKSIPDRRRKESQDEKRVEGSKWRHASLD